MLLWIFSYKRHNYNELRNHILQKHSSIIILTKKIYWPKARISLFCSNDKKYLYFILIVYFVSVTVLLVTSSLFMYFILSIFFILCNVPTMKHFFQPLSKLEGIHIEWQDVSASQDTWCTYANKQTNKHTHTHTKLLMRQL